MKFTVETLNDNGSGMKFTEKEAFLREITMMIADCIENGGTFFDVQIDSDASCFSPEGQSTRKHEESMTHRKSCEPISILVRDCNGKRTNFVFENRGQILDWAEEYVQEDDELLLVTQGNVCLYSALGSNAGLTSEDIVGFFA